MPRQLADIAPHITGTLRIAWLTGITYDPLDRALCWLRQTYPGVQLGIDVASEETIARAVQRNDVDIGISSNRVRIAELDAHLLFRERHQAYCGRGFPLFGKTIERLEDHAEEPFILGGVDEPDKLKEFRHRTGVGRNAVATSDNIAEQRRLAILGLGICFLPVPYVADDVAAGRLWPLTPDRTDWEIDIFALTNRRSPHRHLIGAFLAALQTPG
jgi:DNA-binding transcriptional LysR family regulator